MREVQSERGTERERHRVREAHSEKGTKVGEAQSGRRTKAETKSDITLDAIGA